MGRSGRYRPAEFPEKRLVFVMDQIIEPDPGTDKDLFYIRQRAQLLKQRQVIPVIHPKVFAGLRKQTLPVLTDAVF